MKKLYSSLLLILCFKSVSATAPAWTITPGLFQYNMTVTAVLNSNCVELNNSNNILGAFVNDTCRGFIKTTTVVSGRRLAYLFVYSNVPSGETVKFKYYDAVTDSVYDSKVTLSFLSDGTFGSNASPYVIKNNDAPTSISLSKLSILEDALIGQTIAGMKSVDSDVLNTHTYTLVAGVGSTDNAKLFITADSLYLNAGLNFKTQDSLFIRIRSTDNFGCYYEQAFIIVVQHVNHTPTDITLSDSTIFENKPVSTVIGNFSTTDIDAGDAFTYTLVSGVGDTDNVSFTINAGKIYSAKSFNFEKKKVYGIRVRSTDLGGAFVEKKFLIIIKDVNDQPTDIVLATNRIYENLPVGSYTTKLFTVDEDVNDLFKYTFANIGTNDNTSFTISNDTLKSAFSFDFETKKTYSIYLTTTDSSGANFTKQFNILIRDSLDTPTNITLSDSIVNDNAPIGTYIGAFSTIDVNGPLALHSYTLVSGLGSADNSSFKISNDSIFTFSTVNYATKNAYSIRVRSTVVNGLYCEKRFGIIIVNIDTITDITINNNRIYENSAPNAAIGQLSTVSTDTLNKYTYTFDNSVVSDNASFTLTSKGLLNAAQTFDYETKSNYNISVTTTNPVGTSFTRQLSILIRDTLDTPLDIKLSDSLVVDNSPAKTYVGKLSTIDVNGASAIHTYSLSSIIGSVDDTSFVVSNDTLYTKPQVDYSTQNAYKLKVRSSLINGLYVEKLFSIRITNIGEGPHVREETVSVREDATPQYLITVSVKDTDKYSPYLYELLAKNVPFSMDPGTGKLKLTGALDFHKQAKYELPFRVTDNMDIRDSSVIIVTVVPVEEEVLPVNNYVSPNGDGKNDYFAIVSPEVYREYELTIYNSSGVAIFKTKEYNNEWNGSDVLPGVYYYTFLGNKEYKGNIVLVK